MSNAKKIARYITTIDSTPSYAINILVVKPMTVAATSFFFIHTLLIFFMTRAAFCVNNTNSVFRVHNKIIVSFLCEY